MSACLVSFHEFPMHDHITENGRSPFLPPPSPTVEICYIFMFNFKELSHIVIPQYLYIN